MRKTILIGMLILLASMALSASIIQIRRDTNANWATANPILAQGEPGFVIDTFMLKFGNGTDHWNDLNYYSTGGGSGGSSGYLFTKVNFDSNFFTLFKPNFDNNQFTTFKPLFDSNFFTLFKPNFDNNQFTTFKPLFDSNFQKAFDTNFLAKDQNVYKLGILSNDRNQFQIDLNAPGKWLNVMDINARDANYHRNVTVDKNIILGNTQSSGIILSADQNSIQLGRGTAGTNFCIYRSDTNFIMGFC
jgi:hypothetical protein